jgi:hypothetical protein
MFLLVVGFLAFIFLATGATLRGLPEAPGTRVIVALLTFPGAYDAVLAFLLGLGALLALVYGAAIAGSEWVWGTLKNAVARGESRAGYAVTLFLAIAIVLAAGVLLAVGIGVATAALGASLAGISTAGIADGDALAELPGKLVRAWVGMAEAAAIGFATANLARSQLAGIGVGVATYFGEQFSTVLFPDVVKYLPFHAAEAAANVTPPTGDGSVAGLNVAYLPPDTALAVALLWLITAVLVSAVVTQRADITG